MSLDMLPINLTVTQAIELAELLKKARIHLRDAAGFKFHSLNYASVSSEIARVLRTFDIDPD